MHKNQNHGLAVWAVMNSLLKNPCRHLIRRWNWKTACLSALLRGLVIFAANLPSGGACASDVMLVEICYRGLTSGFFSAAIQSFRCVRPVWAATVAAMVLIPAMADALEIAVQRLCGTQRLGATMAASLIVTAISVLFELYAMRRGVFVIGTAGRSFWGDLCSLPKLCCEFVAEGWKWIGKKNPIYFIKSLFSLHASKTSVA